MYGIPSAAVGAGMTPPSTNWQWQMPLINYEAYGYQPGVEYYGTGVTPEVRQMGSDYWTADFERKQGAYKNKMAGLSRLMSYSNIANAFASRGMGPGSGLYYGAAGELQDQQPQRGGNYMEMLQSLISQMPGGQELY